MSSTDKILDALYPNDPPVEIKGVTTYQLREALIHELYFYEDPITRTRTYSKFCEKNVHRQCIFKPVLEINIRHLSHELRQELAKLKKTSQEAYEEIITDAVIRLYDLCNTTSWNNIVERRYAKWVLV